MKPRKRYVGKLPLEERRYRAACRLLVNAAVAAGRIVKPEACEQCGSTNLVEGHHEDYAKPLLVAWVCRACHSLVHRIRGRVIPR